MSNEIQVAKWGNSFAVRIPRSVVKQARLTEGDRLSLDLTRDGRIVLRPNRRRYELDDLVGGITPKNRHHETEWGAPRGKEFW